MYGKVEMMANGRGHLRIYKCLRDNARVAIIGFCSDAGVERNKGRIGAKDSPDIIRMAMANFSVLDDFCFQDLGNVSTGGIYNDLERAVGELEDIVSGVLNNKSLLILGGGHETSLAGIRAMIDRFGEVGVINFDAHFDVRIQDMHTSGNSFYKAYLHAKQKEANFGYLCLGASRLSNTKILFDTMESMNAKYVLDTDMQNATSTISSFPNSYKHIYLSIDIDVFASYLAPGVSAPAIYGLDFPLFLSYLTMILESKKVCLADICEFNPRYDIDNRTARLSAFIAERILRAFHHLYS